MIGHLNACIWINRAGEMHISIVKTNNDVNLPSYVIVCLYDSIDGECKKSIWPLSFALFTAVISCSICRRLTEHLNVRYISNVWAQCSCSETVAPLFVFFQWHWGQKTNLQHSLLAGRSAVRAGLWHCASGLWKCLHSLCSYVRRRTRRCHQPDARATQPGSAGDHSGGWWICLQTAPMVSNCSHFTFRNISEYSVEKILLIFN